MILVVDDGIRNPQLIELNYYATNEKDKTTLRFHFNREIINQILPINRIFINENRAYLVGNNVHFIYRHGIYHKFTKRHDVLLYEFIDRGMQDIYPMKSLSVDLWEHLEHDTIFFYAVNSRGLRVFSHRFESPVITCNSGVSSS